MPTKLGKGGAGQQNYVPKGNGDASGEYGDNANGSNKHFISFKKPREYKQYWKKDNDKVSHGISRIEYEKLKKEGNKDIFEKPATFSYNYMQKEEPITLDKEQEQKVEQIINSISFDGNRSLDRAFGDVRDKINYNLGFKTVNERYYLTPRIAEAFYDEVLEKWQTARDNTIKEGKENLEKNYIKIEGDHTPDEDLKEVNLENFKKSQVGTEKYEKFTSNCQRCVQAYVLRRKGYNVEAKEFLGDENESKLSSAGWEKAIFIEPEYGWDLLRKDDLGATVKTQFKNINKIVGNSEDGAIYMCSIKYKGSKSSHVFIVEKQDGKVRFVDPQNGRTNNERYFEKDLFGNYRIEPWYTHLLRVDNLDINTNVDLVARSKK